MMIVRLSRHPPQSRTPSVAPEPGFNDDESGAHMVFGIARRVPPPNNPQKIVNTRIVSDSAKYIPRSTVERRICTQVQSADVFGGVTSHHYQAFI